MIDIDIAVKNAFDIVWKELLKNEDVEVSSVSFPKSFVLGGQPGAGKSQLLQKASLICRSNLIIISGDDFRKFHPDYERLQKEHGKDSPSFTSEFSAKMTEAVLRKAISEHYNIAIEGTFRTSEVPIKTLTLLKTNGYKTKVMIQTCCKELSWKSCQERYERMMELDPKEARWTNKDHHDMVCQNLADNILKVYESGLVDEMEIFSRDEMGNNKIIYTSKSSTAPSVNAINNELGKLIVSEPTPKKLKRRDSGWSR